MFSRKQKIWTFILISLFILGAQGTGWAKAVSVVDADGVTVQVQLPVKRVVCLSSAINEVLFTLGVNHQVVGIDANSNEFALLGKLPIVASSSAKPQIEAILQLKPDLILADTMLTDDARNKFNSFGIPVIVERASEPERLPLVIRNIALVMERQERGEELIAFINKYDALIADRVKNLKTDQRVRVFWEWKESYKTGSATSSVDPRITLTGGVNICHNVEGDYPIVSSEYVWQQNPQVIIKMANRGDTKEMMRQFWNELMNRPGLKETSAVKNKRVYIISWEIHNGLRSVIGNLYYAKWLHPDLFADIDPEAVHMELLKKFYQSDSASTVIYP